MNKTLNITGEKYGKLRAMFSTQLRSKEGCVIWLFKCDCGKEFHAPASLVARNRTRSCGCGKKGGTW